MGVICFDGNVLASDSQSTCEHVRRMGTTRRLFAAGDWDNWKVEGKKALAFAYLGKIGNAGPWIAEALTQGLKHNTTLAVGLLAFDAIIVTEDAAFIWKYHKEGRGDEVLSDLHPIIGATALGSGGPMAVAVMSVGKGAREAVEAVIKFDILSGGLVQTWTRKEPDMPTKVKNNLQEISYLAKNLAACEVGTTLFEDAVQMLRKKLAAIPDKAKDKDPEMEKVLKEISRKLFEINAVKHNYGVEVADAMDTKVDNLVAVGAPSVKEAKKLYDTLCILKGLLVEGVTPEIIHEY